MEDCQKISKAKYFYFSAGFCLVAILAIVYSGNWQSEVVRRPHFRLTANQRLTSLPAVGYVEIIDDVDGVVTNVTVNLLQQRKDNLRAMMVSDQWDRLEDEGPTVEHFESPVFLDGTYRDSPAGYKGRSNMLSNRIRDNYTHCSGIAPFVGPYPYTPKSDNPCWYRNKTFVCVPNFYLAGFSKSGTSDLYGRLAKHPQVSQTLKEKHWLDYRRYFKTFDTIDYYAELFERTAIRIQRELKENGNSKVIIGDGTPCYAWASLYWRCYEGNQGLDAPKFTNADVIHRLTPKAKIIFMLRDPAARLYSRYLTWVGRMPHKAYQEASPQAFHSLVVKAINLFHNCVKKWSVRHCAYNGTLYTHMSLRLTEGMYSVFLEDWLKVFPRNQILVLRFESYVIDIKGSLGRVFQFLNIDELPESTVDKIVAARTRNRGRNYYIGKMLNATRDLLHNFYEPFNNVLPHLLKDKTLQWD